MNKRILLLLTVVALMVAMMVVMAAPASARFCPSGTRVQLIGPDHEGHGIFFGCVPTGAP
jgi:hypothetical protein